MKILLQTASVMTLALLATGCSTPVPQVLKPTDVPSAFTSPIPPDTSVWPKMEWWNGFGSTEMNGLIVQAQADNLNLEVAIASVLQAKANREVVRAALFPDINLEGSAQRNSTPIGTIVGLNGAKGNLTQNSFALSADASYELDFWGLAQDNLRAADESLKAAKYNQQIVALTVTTSVATTYFDVLALREEVTVTEQNLDAANRILKITQAQVTNGVASNLNLAQQQALVESVAASLAPLKEQEREALFSLAILLGHPPEGFDVTAKNLDGIASPLIAPGIPSALLERRPDVAQAEANLAAAHADVDAARAAFFPQIGLTGNGGLSSLALGTLFQGSSFGWGIGASLLQTLFDGGKLTGELKLAKAQQLGLAYTYRNTVISAFSGVETALSQTANYADEQAALEREVKASAEAFRLSELQYREGVADLLTVLQTEQTLFAAEVALVQAKLARLTAVVSLYNAMGGGWTENPKEKTQTVIPVSTDATPPATPATTPATPAPSPTKG